jgi:hypothetical protein
MTISDVLVAAPWIVFGVAFAVICIRLLGSRRASGRQRRQSRPSPAAPDGPPARTGPRGLQRGRGDVPATPSHTPAEPKRMRRLKPFAVKKPRRVRRSRNGQDTGRKAENANVEAR